MNFFSTGHVAGVVFWITFSIFSRFFIFALQEAVFEHLVNRNVTEEERNQLRWYVIHKSFHLKIPTINRRNIPYNRPLC